MQLVADFVKRQLGSYREFPPETPWDEGYRAAMEAVLHEMVKTDGRVKK